MDELINKQSVMDCFKKWRPYMATKLWDFEQELSAIPSVKSQEKTGHWIQENSVLRCSICDVGVARYDKYSYCPNCGAKMVKAESEE